MSGHRTPTTGEWMWSLAHRQPCKVVESESLWGQDHVRVWLPVPNVVVRVEAASLKPLADGGLNNAHSLAYITAAARIADAITQDVLLAPIEASVIPLPHQIRALSRAVEGDRIRYLLADEVGLGKTIEAGLILRELKLRGAVRRALVIAPKGLVTQWVAEMKVRFKEDFHLIVPSELSAYRRLANSDNVWRSFDQVVCPLDSVKPLDTRRGWSRDEVAEYNRERFEDLLTAGWDLIVVDEAHRLGGSTEQVARYKLARGLSEAAPYLLLLSATPHQGKTDAFHRLVALLDKEAFPDIGSVSQERVRPYVIRTEKRHAIDAQGNPLFLPRRTSLFAVTWEARHREQKLLYEAVSTYVREGYNQAIKEKKSYVGFLLILMQRLVTSSTRAIRTTLERRLAALALPEEQLSLFPSMSDDDLKDMDAQELVDALLKSRIKALKDERREVELLLETTKRTEAAGPDAKAEALLEWIYRLQQEEQNPDLKVLIFTEFVPTQEMLRDFLAERSFDVVCLNGSMNMEERQNVQDAFAKKARVLISTDAGGEGLNLQFCHVVVNFDLPWNPMRLEQRIGRVDRIGQTHVVRAINFVFADTVEYRVREVLEEKLAVILQEFGVDKTGDVLDSAQAGEIFDDLYIDTLLHPQDIERRVDQVVNRVREQVQVVRENATLLSGGEPLKPDAAQRLLEHPLPHWIERMTVNFMMAYGGKAERRGHRWNLTWPDGQEAHGVLFTSAESGPSAVGDGHLTLEEPRIRDLVLRMPRFTLGQPVAVLRLAALPGDVAGLWSLWKVELHSEGKNRNRVMSLFCADDGRVLLPTARFIWDQCLTDMFEPARHLSEAESSAAFDRMRDIAEQHGKPVYDELVQKHHGQLAQQRDKGEYAFTSRRGVIERVGLPAVRAHRLAQLGEEQRTWRSQLDRQAQISPELVPLVLVRVEGGAA
jgi:SNF2 family DNA or RNA helicase